MKSHARYWLCGLLMAFSVAAIPCMASAQTLGPIIQQLRADDMIRRADQHLDAMVSCIADREIERNVGISFQERTGITLEQLQTLLNSEAGKRLRAGAYEDYGIVDALLLGAAPFTNPSALMRMSTAYAVPGHVLLTSPDRDRREMLLGGVISGDIAATRYTAPGRYELVRPAQPAWPRVLEQIRGEPWNPDARGYWEGGTLVVTTPPVPSRQDLVEPNSLQFIIPGDSELADTSARAPVIAWDVDDSLPESVRFDYSEGLYFSIADVAFAASCIEQPSTP